MAQDTSQTCEPGEEFIKVVVRCHPGSREEAVGPHKVVEIESEGTRLVFHSSRSPDKPHAFSYGAVYDEQTPQQDVYQGACQEAATAVISGYNAAILAYGQTDSSKTHTILGGPGEAGVIRRSCRDIFDAMGHAEAHLPFTVTASCFSIYQEKVLDLLTPPDDTRSLRVRERPGMGTYVEDLLSQDVEGTGAVEELLKTAISKLSHTQTSGGEDASRCAVVFSLTVHVTQTDEEGEGRARAGQLYFVDMEGSERPKRTSATDENLMERTKIGMSLSPLGLVVSSLTDFKAERKPYIPYRNSKLTYILKDALGGNCKTVVLAHISLSPPDKDNTISTLRYAHRMQKIKNKPRVNYYSPELPTSSLNAGCEAEIEKPEDASC